MFLLTVSTTVLRFITKLQYTWKKNVCSKILYKTFSLQMFDEHGNAFML